MGYDTYFWGSIKVEPQIPENRWPGWGGPAPAVFFTDGVLTLNNVDGARSVGIKPDGTIGVIGDPGHTEILCELDESIRGDIGEELQRAVDWALAEGATTLEGTIDAQGEENHDRYRYRVAGGVIHSERPKLVWPNGDEQEP